jgi:hypothetical protein
VADDNVLDSGRADGVTTDVAAATTNDAIPRLSDPRDELM